MSAAYLATPKVRHLAVWTADLPSNSDVGHRWRPMCGRRPRGLLVSPNVISVPEWLSPEWREQVTDVLRRPVCKDCAREARSAYELAGGAS